ncbi:uncharacterized protein LOC112180081 isoform X2 [Rosa chinensis]|uniref:uncharacterized protein LOC112180081 isoform X2 n=1 Tax=Rosa chinensis TaxID=74649 RepID=UPI001AD8BE17|nr:uncharacterized protein LOC112180081 isoform X2 [Rosa chinensis]
MGSTMFAATSIFPEPLNLNNYNHWNMRVKTYLLAEGLWNVVKETTKPEDDDSEAEWFEAWTMKNAKALHVIQNSCGSDMFSLICDIDTAKTAWEILERECKEVKADTDIVVEEEEERKSGRTGIQTQDEEDEENKGENNTNKFKRYETFFNHVSSGNWPEAKKCLEEVGIDINEAVRVRDLKYQYTALYLAAKEGHAKIVKELLSFMTEKELEVKNTSGYTPLGIVAKKDYGGESNAKEVARYMVEKNKNVLTIGINPPHNWFPVVEACSWNRWELARYLYSVTPHEDLLAETRPDGPQILTYCFKHMKGFDIARDILRRNSILALTKNYDGEFPMSVLACVDSATFNGRPLKHWQKWIYDNLNIDGVHMKPVDPIRHEISINVSKPEDDQDGSPTQDLEEDVCATANNHSGARWTTNCSVMNLYRGSMRGVRKLLGIESIYEMKVIHLQILGFIRCMGEMIQPEKLTEVQLEMAKKSIFLAVERGNVEYVTEIFKANRKVGMIRTKDEKGRNIFHAAIECRQINIYNLIYGLRKEKRSNLACTVTSSHESMLHMAGKLSPLSQFDRIQGAYLQLQRELQWFKEVESIVPVEMHESLNTSHMTPRELFTKNHEKLMNNAEKSIKETATSCTVVAALIVTIMFAVAFTAPGGSDSNTEDDFLASLPTKMMIGLSTLFLSISAMMIAFSAAVIVMTGDNGNSKTFIGNLLLAFLPITISIWMQFSLIVEIFISTYGPGIFNKKVRPWY